MGHIEKLLNSIRGVGRTEKGITYRKTKSNAFTLIELLVSIAIIGLLIGLLITNIDRNLTKNQVSNDIDLFRSKIEEIRLLAGSTQQSHETSNTPDSSLDDVKYYAIYIPNPGTANYFLVVKISSPINLDEQANVFRCSATVAPTREPCIVERVNLSRNVQLEALSNLYYIAFAVPTEKPTKITYSGSAWQEEPPVYSSLGPIFRLFDANNSTIEARVELEDYSAKMKVTYDD